jgi:glycosyltransferase 2 family protein
VNNKLFKLLLGILVGASFIFLLTSQVDLLKCLKAAQHVSFLYIILAILVMFLGHALRCLRWHQMILLSSECAISYFSCLGPYFASYALNNVLPFRSGDALRAFGFNHMLKTSPSSLLGILVVERLFDLMILIGLVFTVFWQLPSIPSSLKSLSQSLLVAGFSTLLMVSLLPKACIFLCNTLLSSKWLKPFAPLISLLDFSISTLKAVEKTSSLRRWPFFLMLSILGWLCEWFIFVILFFGLTQQFQLKQTISGFACGTLATLMPGLPGHFGTFDFFATQAMILNGTELNLATVIVLLVHVIIWAPVTVVGMIYLLRYKKQPRQKLNAAL